MSISSKPQWTRQSSALQPPSRKAGSMVYDAERQVSLLFGGGGNNDTWIWDGKNWHELTPAQSPPARMNASMVYDASRKSIVLFGGLNNAGQLLNDTWIWDGKNWRQANPASTPTPRSGAAIAYDDARQLIVLFGGQTNDNRYGMLLNDTWIWNGSTWIQAAPATKPLARQGASFTSYTAGQHLVLFGGSTGHALLGDTWIWDGSNWQEHTSAEGPSPRVWATMTYHTHTQQAILIGGAGEGSAAMPVALGDTWTWNGSSWQQVTSSTMPGVDYHCAVYDEARKVVAVYAATADKIDQGTGDSTSFHSETWVMS